MTPILRVLHRIETLLVGLAGIAVLLLALALAQVVARYLFPRLVAGGGEELTVYLFVWAALIACAGQVTLMGHVRANLLLRQLPLPLVRVD